MKVLRCHVGHTTIFHCPLPSAILLCKLINNNNNNNNNDNNNNNNNNNSNNNVFKKNLER